MRLPGSFRPPRRALQRLYERLLAAYGPQHWWPGDSAFEVMVGAVLTQNTAWRNVERAIANLKGAGVLDPRGNRRPAACRPGRAAPSGRLLQRQGAAPAGLLPLPQ